eukprot:GEMP01000827.1.p1 GENE.GEMP01000827.1~~GEMP01000827.1.p1  ORF type:complete len:1345 (+),score=272.82 GEMP01000827.1:202-4236(+)
MEEGLLVYSRKVDEARYKKALTEVIRNAQLSGPLPASNFAAPAPSVPDDTLVSIRSEDASDSDVSGPALLEPAPDVAALRLGQDPDSSGAPPLTPDTARNVKNHQLLAAHQFGFAPGDGSRGPLLFSSSFEAANLASARYLGKDDKLDEEKHVYELLMEGDTHAVTHTQWYNYIAASSSTKQEVVVFKIVNFRKKRSLHSSGMKPYVYSERAKQWDPLACTNVGYGDGGSGHRSRGTYVLTFTYTFHPLDSVQFAMYPPYSYSTLRKFISALLTKKTAQHHVSVHELCRSIGSVPVPLLLISQNMGDNQLSEAMRPMAAAHAEISGRARKRSVVIIARQHAGEIVCSYMVEGLIRFLVGPSPEAQALREQYIFHVVPMVNVDGVIYGNSRCTLAGVDPNRVWSDPNPIMHPVVYAMKEYMRKIIDVSPVDLFLDFHGHSQKCGTFFYGCGSTEIRNAVFPKVASLSTYDVFFDECRWRIPGRGHTKTARHVIYKQFDIPYSYTIEASFFAQHLPSPQALSRTGDRMNYSNGTEYPFSLFTPFRVETIGLAIGRSMNCFFKLQPRLSSESPDEDEPEMMPPELEARFHTLPLEPRAKGAKGHQQNNFTCPWLTFGKLARAWPDDVLDGLVAMGSTVHDLVKESDYDAVHSHSSDDDNDGDKERKEDRDKTPSKGKVDYKDRKRSISSKSVSKKTPREPARRRNTDDTPLTPREARGPRKVPKRDDSWPLRSGRKRCSKKRELKSPNDDLELTPEASKHLDMETPRTHLTGTSSASTTDSTHSVTRPIVDRPTVSRPARPAPNVPADSELSCNGSTIPYAPGPHITQLVHSSLPAPRGLSSVMSDDHCVDVLDRKSASLNSIESHLASERTNAGAVVPLDDSWLHSRANVFAHNVSNSNEDNTSVAIPSIGPSAPSFTAMTDANYRTFSNFAGRGRIGNNHLRTIIAYNDAQGSSVKALQLHARVPSKSKRGTISSSPFPDKSESSQSSSVQRASPLDNSEASHVQAISLPCPGVKRTTPCVEHSAPPLRGRTSHRPYYQAASPRDIASEDKGACTGCYVALDAPLDRQVSCSVEPQRSGATQPPNSHSIAPHHSERRGRSLRSLSCSPPPMAAATADISPPVGDDKRSDDNNEPMGSKMSGNPIECMELTGLSERALSVRGTWKPNRSHTKGIHAKHHHQHLRPQNKGAIQNGGSFRSARAVVHSTDRGEDRAAIRTQTQALAVPIKMDTARASITKGATSDPHCPPPVKFPPTWRRVMTESKLTFTRENGIFLGHVGIPHNTKSTASERRGGPEHKERPRSSHRLWSKIATGDLAPSEEGGKRNSARLMSERKPPPTLIQKSAH